MPVRSPHEGPALTLEILRAMPEEELALSEMILSGWVAGRIAAQVGPEQAPPVVADRARGVVNTLLLHGAVCPRCAAGFLFGEARNVLVSCVMGMMMEGAEALRWHQLAHQPPIEQE